MWCTYFQREYDSVKDLQGYDYLAAEGMCHRDPESISVSGNHYCSSFAMKVCNNTRGTTPIAIWWLSNSESNDTEKKLRAENKRLKERIKALNSKLKGADS